MARAGQLQRGRDTRPFGAAFFVCLSHLLSGRGRPLARYADWGWIWIELSRVVRQLRHVPGRSCSDARGVDDRCCCDPPGPRRNSGCGGFEIGLESSSRGCSFRCRAYAILNSRATAAVFEHCDDGSWRCFIAVDGNGDGIRTRDIHRLIDPVVGEVLHLDGGGAGLGILQGEFVPDPSGRGRLRGDLDDPVRAGRGNIITFTPRSTATPASIYLTDHRARMRVLRVYGGTGRVISRVWRSGWTRNGGRRECEERQDAPLFFIGLWRGILRPRSRSRRPRPHRGARSAVTSAPLPTSASSATTDSAMTARSETVAPRPTNELRIEARGGNLGRAVDPGRAR